MLWLYFDFPRLQLETQVPDRESLPAAVVMTSDNRLVQVNSAAQTAGIRSGMGVATAAALCRDIQLLPYKADLEHQRLGELAQELYTISGEVALDPPCGVWLGATTMVKYHNGLGNYCKNIERLLGDFQLSYRFGSGYTPLAARLLAHAEYNRADDERESLNSACAHCSLTLTPLSEKIQERLKRLGLRYLQDLLSLPMKELARRFEPELVQYLGRLTGQLPHLLPRYHPPEYFQRYRELPHELDTSGRLMPWLELLLQDMEGFLRRHDRVVERIELRLHPYQGAPRVVPVGAARGETRAEQWLRLAQLTLEQAPLSHPVFALGLQARELLPRSASKSDFFTEGTRGNLDAQELVALLQARLGKASVQGLTLQDDFRPLQASAACAPFAKQVALSEEVQTGLRPSFLLPQPLPYRKPLALLEGPERIATGWWDGEPQMRDYYVARNGEGQWCWVFREPGHKVWFLQGYFS